MTNMNINKQCLDLDNRMKRGKKRQLAGMKKAFLCSPSIFFHILLLKVFHILLLKLYGTGKKGRDFIPKIDFPPFLGHNHPFLIYSYLVCGLFYSHRYTIHNFPIWLKKIPFTIHINKAISRPFFICERSTFNNSNSAQIAPSSF